MPGGRVFLAGAPGDRLLEWVRGRLSASGFQPVALIDEDDAARGAAPLSLAPVVAGFDLWRVAGEERFEAIAALDERLPPGRPLLSLCSASQIDEVASYAVRGERVVGFSLFGPPRAGMLVELIPGLTTVAGALDRARGLLEALGLTTETLPAGSWAVYPRIISMVVNEAAVAIMEHVASADDIDTAVSLGANYPQGPLAQADEIGLGEILAVLEALHAEYGDDRYRPAPLLRRLVLAGYTGKDAGRGFHSYS